MKESIVLWIESYRHAVMWHNKKGIDNMFNACQFMYLIDIWLKKICIIDHFDMISKMYNIEICRRILHFFWFVTKQTLCRYMTSIIITWYNRIIFIIIKTFIIHCISFMLIGTSKTSFQIIQNVIIFAISLFLLEFFWIMNLAFCICFWLHFYHFLFISIHFVNNIIKSIK